MKWTPLRVVAALAAVGLAGAAGAGAAWRWSRSQPPDDAQFVSHGHAPDGPEHAFYEPPVPLPPGLPGELIRSEPFLVHPPGVRVVRLLYHSRTADDRDIAVSGVLAYPDGDPPTGGFPVVAFAHPTVGIARKCALSANLFVPLLPIDVRNIYEVYMAPFVRAGYAVVASDYQGLGAPGPYSYLVGDVEGRNVLDAVRAARRAPGARLRTDLALFGHSQGGHAAAFARQLAARYAPELRVTGAVLAAPASELRLVMKAVLDRPEKTPLTGMVAMAAVAWVETYAPALRLSDIMSPEGIAATRRLGEHCLLLADMAYAAQPPAAYFPVDPASVPSWAAVMERNTPSSARIDVPVLIVQGDDDAVVPSSSTELFVARLHDAGNDVLLLKYPGAGHFSVLHQAMPDIVRWIADSLPAVR